MSRKKKILLQTNASWLKTGLALNGRYLMKHLLKTGKYEVVYYCTNGIFQHDPNLGRMPCKAYGCLPSDQNVLNHLGQNPGYARDVGYGAYFIDEIMKNERPDIYWESDDLWSTNGYIEKPWFQHTNAILHKTADSTPILDVAYQQAKATKNYFTWVEFAADEMKRVDPTISHVKHIYGMCDTEHFSPITPKEKADLRRKFNLDQDCVIFHFTGRNQYRKRIDAILEAFALFKSENPKANAKLHIHTAFGEKGQGWDIPKIAQILRLKQSDILCTYVCRNCGEWHISPYLGEDIDCPYCGAKKSMGTPTVAHGVPDEEMKLMHGVCDAMISAYNSGGLEYANVNALLCGMPLAATDYFCGVDFCKQPFVHAIKWNGYRQEGTNFTKAANDPKSIRDFMVKIYTMSAAEKQRISEEGRAWSMKTFSVETIGAQWEAVFDSIIPKDWSSIVLEYVKKNESYPMPQIEDNESWLRALYNNILMVEPDPKGLSDWMTSLANGAPREHIYNCFVNIAKNDNAKNGKPPAFSSLLDKESGKKRGLIVIKESIGDCVMITQLFESFHEQYPNTDLYVATDPKYFEIFDGNPHVKKCIPYMPHMENELHMIGAGQKGSFFDVYMHPAIGSQRILSYLSNSNPLLLK